MASEEPVAGDEDPVAAVRALLEGSASVRRHLPALLGHLDADDAQDRLTAAWGLTIAAGLEPDAVAYLVRRLAARLHDEPTLETRLAIATLGATHPAAVAAACAELATERADGDDVPDPRRVREIVTAAGNAVGVDVEGHVGRSDAAEHGGEAASESGSPSGSGSAGSGATSAASADSGTDAAGRGSGASATSAGGNGAVRAGGPAGEDGSAGPSGDSPSGEGGSDGPPATFRANADEESPLYDVPLTLAYPVQEEAGSWASVSTLGEVATRSRFSEMTIYGRRRGRYADRYRALAFANGREHPIALCLFHRPEDDRDAFAEALGEELGRWAGVDDHAGVVDVHDWGLTPRPWAAVGFTESRLAGRDLPDVETGLWNAGQLADALAHCHDHGVVHAGLDPGNVAYAGTIFGDEGREPPLLTGVGLLNAFRLHFDPAEYLDPRYAAPEYYDGGFGDLDHRTDVYHLGGVCYRLLTGEPPYDGSYAEVRSRVLSDSPPVPSERADVPEAVDAVVTKAMAKDKLDRYETVAYFASELRAVDPEG